jgi:hypothetical protein
MKSVRPLMLEEKENVSEVTEGPGLVLGYEMQFLSNDGSQNVHKVQVRSINFQDVIRHLRQGDSVFITPKLAEDLDKKKKQDQGFWYFTHL